MLFLARALLCLPWLAGAAHPQTPLTLASAVQEALDRHPSLAAASHRIAAAEGAVRQAGVRPNPRAYLQVENLRAWGQPALVYPTDTDNFAYVSQSFEMAGKRGRRIEVAEAALRRATLDRQVAAREIAAQVAASYWPVVAARSLRELLRDDLAAYESTVEYHRNRVREGAMAEVDLMRVLLERDRLVLAVRSAEMDLSRATLVLLRSLGRPSLEEVEVAGGLAAPPEVPLPEFTRVVEARPETQAAREAIAQARANASLQQAGATPDPEVLFGYKRNAGFNTLMGGLQIELPVRKRNQGLIAAAAAEVRAAESQAAAVELRLLGEMTAAFVDYRSRRRLLAETLEPMRERAAEIARIARAAYLEGGTDLPQVIDAERARIEALIAYQRALGEMQQSYTLLRLSLGEMP